MRKRKIAIIHGSDSDLAQMRSGLICLEDSGADVIGIYRCSVHRNPVKWLIILLQLSFVRVDVIIAGAGWANHLTAMTDKWLRNLFHNYHTLVVGVAFEDEKNNTHTLAAKLSITEVPGHDVVFNNYVGTQGFHEACEFATKIVDFPKIMKIKPKPAKSRSLQKAIIDTFSKDKEGGNWK